METPRVGIRCSAGAHADEKSFMMTLPCTLFSCFSCRPTREHPLCSCVEASRPTENCSGVADLVNGKISLTPTASKTGIWGDEESGYRSTGTSPDAGGTEFLSPHPMLMTGQTCSRGQRCLVHWHPLDTDEQGMNGRGCTRERQSFSGWLSGWVQGERMKNSDQNEWPESSCSGSESLDPKTRASLLHADVLWYGGPLGQHNWLKPDRRRLINILLGEDLFSVAWDWE